MANLTLPKGWACEASPGWALVHYAATGAEPPAGPQVEINGRSHPRDFSLVVAVDQQATRTEEAVQAVIGLMFRIDEASKEIRLAAVMSLQGEADVLLKVLASHAPMEWWKRKAFYQLALDDLRRWEQLNPGSSDGHDIMRLITSSRTNWATTVPTTRRRNRISEARLEEVAQIYREAADRGDNPTQAVADATHASHSHAAYLVSQARKKGKLPPYRSRTTD